MRLHVAQRPKWLSPTGVKVNGQWLKSCIEFDEEEGWATYHPFDSFGDYLIAIHPVSGETYLPLCIIDGDVETTLTDEERERLQNEVLVEVGSGSEDI